MVQDFVTVNMLFVFKGAFVFQFLHFAALYADDVVVMVVSCLAQRITFFAVRLLDCGQHTARGQCIQIAVHAGQSAFFKLFAQFVPHLFWCQVGVGFVENTNNGFPAWGNFQPLGFQDVDICVQS